VGEGTGVAAAGAQGRIGSSAGAVGEAEGATVPGEVGVAVG
jgi:hypothetical protein